MTQLIEPQLLKAIRDVLHKSRTHLQYAVNHTMVETYWQVGRLIVEQEQQGKDRASYGTKQLTHLSEKLQSEFGKGFDVSNLRNMRKFYQSFPIRDAVRPELTWTHYRRLIRLDNQSARDWYLQESIEQNWSSRALERQINKLLLFNPQRVFLTHYGMLENPQQKAEQLHGDLDAYVEIALAIDAQNCLIIYLNR